MTQINPEAQEQIRNAYTRMAEEADYFPGGPRGDSVGHRDIPQEQEGYIRQWWDQEDAGDYHIGVPSQPHRKALIYAVEAANNITNWSPEKAKKLLALGIEEIDSLQKQQNKWNQPDSEDV
ncbi:MAG TPA: hypothetical protein H9822_04955 [Candidatus Yaniella excrementavium]|nr:hypothetical protein [Candidatus Yaniella excrementavium]